MKSSRVDRTDTAAHRRRDLRLPKWGHAAAGLVFGLITLTSVAHSQPAELTKVKAWRGWFRATGHQSVGDLPEFITKPGSIDLNYSMQFSAEVYLDEYDDMPSTWTGRMVSSNLSANLDVNLDYKAGVIDSHFHAAGPLKPDSGDRGPYLVFHVGSDWELHLGNVRLQTTVTAKTMFRPSGYTTTSSQESMVYAPSSAAFPYPAKGLVLRGRKTIRQVEMTSSPLPPFNWPVDFDVEVYLEPTTLQELELEIEPAGDYATWLPTTSAQADAGKPLTVTARLTTKDGGKPMARIESFQWKLVNTSREPGVAMNFPVNAKDRDFDLKLDAQGPYMKVSEDGQQVDRAIQSGFSDTVEVKPYDWGAWSTLQVTAKLTDGREVVGKLKGAKELDLRLPKRSANSQIADYWKQQNDATGGDRTDGRRAGR